ncbi:MAG: CHAT domain-containing protein, partial [Pseudomonadota bacterium]
MTRLRLFFCCLLLATPLDAQDAAPPDALAILDQVFVTAQRANTSVAGAALQQAALRQQAGSAELSELLRERSDLADQAELEQRRLSFAIGETGAAAEAEVARIQARLREIETKTAELDAAIEAGFPEFRELITPRPMDVAEVQATLGEGEVLLFTLSGTWETYIWAISRDRADWHAVFFPDPDEMKGRVTALRRLLSSTENARAAEAMSDDGDSFPAIRAFDRGLAHGIYGDLLAPLAHVFDGAEHLLLVPDGPLTSLPFGLLIASEPQGADDDPFALRDTDWLIKRHALTVLPNVSSLRALRRDETEAPADRRPFVGFGDPIFAYGRDDLGPTGIVAEGDYVTRGAFEELSEVANLAQLPGTRRELRRLA